MMCKKAVLISCFNHYDIRIKYIEQYLRQRNYVTTYITSDYDHISKSVFKIVREHTLQIHAKPYKKNLSFARMLSHYLWAGNVFKEIKRIEPDLLFVMLPPNSLARHASKYCKLTKAKLIFDIYDLWPETYPLRRDSYLKLPFKIWGSMRDRYLNSADIVTVECRLFSERLHLKQRNIPFGILYPALENVQLSLGAVWSEEEVHLAYLGSVNNIIDITKIEEIVRVVVSHKPVCFHVIGAGESKDKLVSTLQSANARVVDHGAIFDVHEKQAILNLCRFGINIMKEAVCVGLTMKSMDYFRAGLPIINNIPGDTQKLVYQKKVGFNVIHTTEDASLVATMTKDENVELRRNARRLYEGMFSPESFAKALESIYESIQT